MVTIVVPIGNCEPDIGLVKTVGRLRLSEAVGSGKLISIETAFEFSGKLSVMLANEFGLITGAVLSILMPVCVFAAVLPAWSKQVPVADWFAPSAVKV